MINTIEGMNLVSVSNVLAAAEVDREIRHSHWGYNLV
jgi:hypothetical protein